MNKTELLNNLKNLYHSSLFDQEGNLRWHSIDYTQKYWLEISGKDGSVYLEKDDGERFLSLGDSISDLRDEYGEKGFPEMAVEDERLKSFDADGYYYDLDEFVCSKFGLKSEHEIQKVLDTPVEELEYDFLDKSLSVNVTKMLKDSGFDTIGDILCEDPRTLINKYNIGGKTVTDVVKAVQKTGIEYASEFLEKRQRECEEEYFRHYSEAAGDGIIDPAEMARLEVLKYELGLTDDTVKQIEIRYLSETGGTEPEINRTVKQEKDDFYEYDNDKLTEKEKEFNAALSEKINAATKNALDNLNQENKNFSNDSITLSVKADITVPFLPNTRSRKERLMNVGVEVPVTIPCPSEKDFPVALKVTDYMTVAQNVSKEDFDKLSGAQKHNLGETSYPTEEIRMYDGRLFKPVHVNLYGSLYSSLYENKPDFIKGLLEDKNTGRNSNWQDYWKADEEGQEYKKESSVINESEKEKELSKRYEKIAKDASHYLMFDNKIWAECGEPYYHIQSFGAGGNYSVGAFINYLNHDVDPYSFFDNTSQWNFSARHMEEFLSEYHDANTNVSLENRIENVKERIDVLIPEAVKIKDFIDIENEKKQEINGQLETIANKNSNVITFEELDGISVIKSFEREMTGFLSKSKDHNPYNASKIILSNWTVEQKTELNKYFKDNKIISKESFDRYFEDTFGIKYVQKNSQALRKEVKMESIQRNRQVSQKQAKVNDIDIGVGR